MNSPFINIVKINTMSRDNNICLQGVITKLSDRSGGVITLEEFTKSLTSVFGALDDIQLGPDMLGMYLAELGLKIKVRIAVYGSYDHIAKSPTITFPAAKFYGHEDGCAMHDEIILVTSNGGSGYGAGHYYLLDGSKFEYTNDFVKNVLVESGGSLRGICL